MGGNVSVIVHIKSLQNGDHSKEDIDVCSQYFVKI